MKKICTGIIIACALFVCGCSEKRTAPSPISKTVFEPVDARATVTVAEKRVIRNVQYRYGTVVPRTEGIYAKSSGTIGEVYYRIGEEVDKYDILLEYDVEAVKAELDELDEKIAALTDKRDAALSVFDEETEQLEIRAGEGGMDGELAALLLLEREKERGALGREYDATLDVYDREYSQLSVTLSGSRVYATCSGIISECRVSEHSYAGAGSLLMAVTDDSDLYIRLTDSNMSDLSASVIDGMRSAMAYIGGKTYPVTFRGREGVGNSLLDIDLSSDESVKAGDSVIVELVDGGSDEAVLSVAKDAVFFDGSVSYVYVLGEGIRRRVDVTCGISDDYYIQITDGDIREGDEIYVP